VLEALDKGHTRADFLQVVAAFRSLGLVLHPTFVPFSPWTTLDSYLDLLRVLDDRELIENVAPIQLGIRLLIPEGSRMLELDDIRQSVGPFDAQSLVYPWRNRDPRVDALAETVQGIAAAADHEKATRGAAFARIWKAAHEATGMDAPELRTEILAPKSGVPFLSEPWYCCAEPTKDQFISIGRAQQPTESKPAVAHAPVTADSFV
jgi:hypothetical protein